MTAYLPCTVAPGLRPQEASVSVYASNGNQEHFPLDRGYLDEKEGKPVIGVWVRDINWDASLVTVGLPVETDSGSHGMMVPMADLIWPDGLPVDPAAGRIARAVAEATESLTNNWNHAEADLYEAITCIKDTASWLEDIGPTVRQYGLIGNAELIAGLVRDCQAVLARIDRKVGE